ncbi:MAG: cytochrome c biogenesis protein CcsA [Desulfovibrio sp.]|jgi:ABC-type uncharacterized transport system permease subunit|nr:cytochrome c biogenesis protein CcsA [Desulfovibrio sp.]
MTFEHFLVVALVFLYSLAALGQFFGLLSRRGNVRTAAGIFTLAAFCLNTLALIYLVALHGVHALSSLSFLLFLAWVIIFISLCLWLRLGLRILVLTATPLALVLTAMSLRSSPAILLPSNLSGLFLTLHVSALFISGGLLTLACGAGALFVHMDRRLKRKAPAALFNKDFPSLSAFDSVNHYAVLAGFPLYTVGLMAGFLWGPLFSQAIENPKVLISLFIWTLYALLFYQRMALGFRGRRTAVMAIAIFAVSVLSFGIDYTLSHHSTLLQP